MNDKFIDFNENRRENIFCYKNMNNRILSGPYSYTRIKLPNNITYILLSDVHGSNQNQCSKVSLKYQLHEWFNTTKKNIDFYLETTEQQLSTNIKPSADPLQEIRYFYAQCFDHGHQKQLYPNVKFHCTDIRHCDYDDLGLSGIWYFITCYLNKNVWNKNYISHYVTKTSQELPYLLLAIKDSKYIYSFLFDRWFNDSIKVKKIRSIEKLLSQDRLQRIRSYITHLYSKYITKILNKYRLTVPEFIHLYNTNNIFHIWNTNNVDTPFMYALASLSSFNGLCLMDYYTLLLFETSTSSIRLIYSGYNHIRNYIEYLCHYCNGKQEIHIGQNLPDEIQDLHTDYVQRCNIMDKSFTEIE